MTYSIAKLICKTIILYTKVLSDSITNSSSLGISGKRLDELEEKLK